MIGHPIIVLPAHCSTIMAPDILAALIDHADRGIDVAIDGSEVEVIGQAMLQILVGAKLYADAADRSFTIVNPSDAMRQRIVRCKLDALVNLESAGSKEEAVS